MKLFNRKVNRHHAASDKAAGWIAGSILKLQTLWANKMGSLFNRLNPSRRKVVLIGCCFFMVAYSSILIAYSFNKAAIVFTKPQSAAGPLLLTKPAPAMPVETPAYIRHIERFRHYLDSLGKTMDGRRLRDSLLQTRPGLLDSIRKIEIIYCNR